jgi:hypothetical protein
VLTDVDMDEVAQHVLKHLDPPVLKILHHFSQVPGSAVLLLLRPLELLFLHRLGNCRL